MGQSLPKTLSHGQVDCLLKTASNMAEAPGIRGFEGRPPATLLEIAYASGLRVSELVALPLAALMPPGFNLGSLAWFPLWARGKNSDWSLGHGAIDALKSYRPKREAYLKSQKIKASPHLFPGRDGRQPLTRQALGQALKKLAGLCAIPPDHISPHVLRPCLCHAFAGRRADLRAIQTLLGHADIATTQIYTHVQDSRRQAVLARHPLAGR